MTDQPKPQEYIDRATRSVYPPKPRPTDKPWPWATVRGTQCQDQWGDIDGSAHVCGLVSGHDGEHVSAAEYPEPRLTEEELLARIATARTELAQVEATIEGEWASSPDVDAIREVLDAVPLLVAEVRRLRKLRPKDPYMIDGPMGDVDCFWCGNSRGEPHDDECSWANTDPEARGAG